MQIRRQVAALLAVMMAGLAFASPAFGVSEGGLTDAERRALAAKFVQRLKPVYSPVEEAGRTIESNGADGIADGTEMILDVRVKRISFDEPILIEKRGDGFAVQLAELVRVLDFPIEVDEQAGRATGWFIRESYDFDLNMEAESLTIAGVTRPLKPHEVELRNGEIWVSDAVAASWFAIAFEADYRQLFLNLDGEEALPIERRIQRQSMRPTETSRQMLPPQHDYLPGPRPLIAAPAIDAQLSGQATGGGGRELTTNARYALSAKAGLLGGALRSFVAGQQSDPVTTGRFTLQYHEPDGFFGSRALTGIELGDVYSVRTPLIRSGAFERGLHLTNLPLGRMIGGDSTTISGNAFPGYDVQLFRGAVLLDSQEVGDDGRYEFLNVPVFVGENEFRLAFFGPQGQQFEETQYVTVDPSALGRSRLTYELSLTQQGTPLLDDSIIVNKDNDDLRVAARLNYAFGGGISADLGGESLTDQGVRKEVGYLGLSTISRGFRGRGAFAMDGEGNMGGEAEVQLRLGNVRLRAEHAELGDIQVTTGSRQPKRNSRAGIDGYFRDGWLSGLQVEAFGQRFQYKDGSEELETGVGLGTSIGRARLSTSLSYQRSQDREQDRAVADNIFGVSQLFGSYGRWRGRITGRYTVWPEAELANASAELGYQFSDKLDSQVEVEHFAAIDRTRVSTAVNYNAGVARIGPRLSWDSENRYVASIDVRFSAVREPDSGDWLFREQSLANDGRLSVRVFLDENDNGAYEPGEGILEGVEISAIHQRTTARTNGRGIAFMPKLRAFDKTDIEIVEGTLPGAYMMPARLGWSVVPRPGVTQEVNLAVVRNWTIEGRLIQLAYDRGPAIADVPVHLVDNGTGYVVATVAAARDGAYRFDKVRPGDYRVEADSDALAALGLQPTPPRPFRTNRETERYVGMDLLTAPANYALSYPTLVSAENVETVANPFLPASYQMEQVALADVPPHHVLLLGTSRSRLGVTTSWMAHARRAPELFQGLKPIITSFDSFQVKAMPAERYPVRVGPIRNRDRAEAICDVLRANGELCTVAINAEVPAQPVL